MRERKSVVRVCVATVASVFWLGACASILSETNYPVTFSSNPSEANVVITDKRGKEIFRGRTPTTLTLAASSGFFSGARYDVALEKEGYSPSRGTLSSELDGWYIGNILFGGLIGMLIVDPATGAMFKLDDSLVVNMTPLPKDAKVQGARTVTIVTLEDIPHEMRSHLIRVN